MDAFEPPKSEATFNVVESRARQNLYKAAATALGFGLFQYCCNPFFLVSIMAGAAAMNAIQQPRWMEIALDEDYPHSAGTLSRICGYIGLALTLTRVLLFVLGTALTVMPS